MATVVIGGQASGVGKTGLICALIRAMPERRWTAIKITQCSHEGEGCDCELAGRAFAISEEHDANAGTDSSRYLAAGAVRSLWVRTLPGHLAEAMPRIEEAIAHGDVMIESNSVMEFLKPDVYAMVVSPDCADFKPTAWRYLDRADAILRVKSAGDIAATGWTAALEERTGSVPQFFLDAERFVSPEFFALVRRGARDCAVEGATPLSGTAPCCEK